MRFLFFSTQRNNVSGAHGLKWKAAAGESETQIPFGDDNKGGWRAGWEDGRGWMAGKRGAGQKLRSTSNLWSA